VISIPIDDKYKRPLDQTIFITHILSKLKHIPTQVNIIFLPGFCQPLPAASDGSQPAHSICRGIGPAIPEQNKH
jgi:hypothetical protein